MTVRPAPATDVLVVGGGPAGFATAIELARRDHRVTVVDRGVVTHHAAMLMTPRAVAAARRLGVDPAERFHPISQVRVSAIDPDTDEIRSISTTWPRHRTVPTTGAVGRRRDLVAELRALAEGLGVTVLAAHDATEPLVERGFVRGARVRITENDLVDSLRGTVTVVADGASSQFGRMLGTFREPEWPIAQAYSAEYASPLQGSGEVELVVGVTDRAGTPIAGFGWMFPTAAGTVSVGVMLLSTSPSYQVTNPAQLHEQFVALHRRRWKLDGPPVGAPSGGRITLGSSVGPLAGPTYLIVGDAGAAANPLSASGIDTALETGIIAGDVIAEALVEGSTAALQRYPHQLGQRYGSYYKVGRLADRLLGQPALARRVYTAMAGRRSFADAVLRVALQHLRGARGGGPELAYRIARTISVFAPDA